MKNVSKTTERLVTSGVLISLATILSIIKVFEFPFGGSITLCSMLPILVLGYVYGVRWGLLCGTVYGILQMVLGATTTQAFSGLVGWTVPVMAALDYIVAFMVLGFSGVFKNKFKNESVSFALGITVAVLLRLVCHFMSGWILWGSYAQGFFEGLANSFGNYMLDAFNGQGLAAMYSLVYNGAYMLPELVISLVGAFALLSVKPLRERIIVNKK